MPLLVADTLGVDTLFDPDGDNSAQELKDGPGELHGILVYNSNAAVEFVQMFDALAADVTVGTDEPKMSIPIPAQSSIIFVLDKHIRFDVGMTYACSDTATGNGDPTTGLVLTFLYL